MENLVTWFFDEIKKDETYLRESELQETFGKWMEGDQDIEEIKID